MQAALPATCTHHHRCQPDRGNKKHNGHDGNGFTTGTSPWQSTRIWHNPVIAWRQLHAPELHHDSIVAGFPAHGACIEPDCVRQRTCTLLDDLMTGKSELCVTTGGLLSP